MRRIVIPAIVAAVAGATQPTTIAAQHEPARTLAGLSPTATTVPDILRTPAGAFSGSLLVPGLGQAALGLRRWPVYAVAEAAAWAVRLDAVGDRGEAARAYRDLAWDEARLPGSNSRVDGTWGYYETMSQYLASGAFDADADTPGVQPEEDPSTYNGAVWALAQALYLPGGEGPPGSPEYQRALDYYHERAAGPAFLWNWAGKAEALDRFRTLIGEADAAARTASAALGAVLANHFISAVDALLVAHVRANREIRLESHTETSGPLRWSVGLRVSLQERQ